jgi:hypothetical protein
MKTLLKLPLAPLVVMSFLLGLAPFTPEPHLIGKIRWVMGGATGMQPIDWGDLAMHGAPIVVLTFALIARVIERSRTPSQTLE